MSTRMTDKLKLIAYCGLYCPKCYNMKISYSSKNLLNELLSAQKKGATYLQDDPSIKKILNKLIDLECIKFCREDVKKSMNCSIKICCDGHDVIGCWKCPDLNSCKKLKKQFYDNCSKLKKLGIEEYIKQYK